MEIRPAKLKELDRILAIYAAARERMIASGNPTQWGHDKPATETVEADIRSGVSYVLMEEGQIAGVFMFRMGEDPTYGIIDGAWLDDARPYGTIHRIAAAPERHGILAMAVDFCMQQVDSLRIDTHRDNAVMQHCIQRCGFSYCGIIITDDGTPRLAYQKLKNDPSRL